MNAEDRVAAVLATIDARDAAAFAEHLAPEVAFRFGNAPTVHGVDAVRTAVEGFLEGIRAVAHVVTDVRAMGDIVVAHGRVTYDRIDDSTLSVPFAIIWYLEGELIAEYLIFVDVSEL